MFPALALNSNPNPHQMLAGLGRDRLAEIKLSDCHTAHHILGAKDGSAKQSDAERDALKAEFAELSAAMDGLKLDSKARRRRPLGRSSASARST